MKNLTDYFNKPKIISIIGDVNTGKTNLIHYLIKQLRACYNFNLVTFGLKSVIKDSVEINSLEQLENTKNSLIFLDEFYTLIDLDDRKKKRMIERTLRLIHHNNNVLVLIGVPENFKKFISSKVDVCMFKQVRFKDFINGSGVKNVLNNYEGVCKGSTLLNVGVGEVLVFDGSYCLFKVDYLKDFDSKKDNSVIFVQK